MPDGFGALRLAESFEGSAQAAVECFVHVFDGRIVGLFAYDRTDDNKTLFYHPLDHKLHAVFPKRKRNGIETPIPSILANLHPDTYRAKEAGATNRDEYYGDQYTSILSRNGLCRISFEEFVQAREAEQFEWPAEFEQALLVESAYHFPPSGSVIIQEAMNVRQADRERTRVAIDVAVISGQKPKVLADFASKDEDDKGVFVPATAGSVIYKYANGEPARIPLEAAGLEAARAIGLSSADYVFVKTVESNRHPVIDLAIKRFDRPADQMILMQDFYSLFGFDSSDEHINTQLTYQSLLEKWGQYLDDHLPADYPERSKKINQEMRNMIDRVFLSMFLNDNDLHPKNFSALIQIDPVTKEIIDISMSPVYDAVPAITEPMMEVKPQEMFLHMRPIRSGEDDCSRGRKPGWTDLNAFDRVKVSGEEITPLRQYLRTHPDFCDDNDMIRSYATDLGTKIYERMFEFFSEMIPELSCADKKVRKIVLGGEERLKVLLALDNTRRRVLDFNPKQTLTPIPVDVAKEISRYRDSMKLGPQERRAMTDARHGLETLYC